MNKRVRHFTAKELAVVVALLCVLTGALIGALTATGRATRGERCLARLRQMGVAMQLYVAANDEYLPLIAYGRLPDVTLFADALRPYAKHHEDLWICPDGDMRPATIASGNGRLLHYGMNDFGYAEVADCVNNYLPTLSGARVSALAGPAAVILAADARPDVSPEDIGAPERFTYSWPLTSLAQERHSAGYNALYLGGAARRHGNQANHQDWTCRKSQGCPHCAASRSE